VGDPLDLAGGVHHGVDRTLLAVSKVLGPLGLAEVHAAGEFANDEDVDTFALAFRPEGAGMGEGLGQLDRAEVREKAELLADSQQGGALGTLVLGDCRIAVGEADGAEEDRVGTAAQLEGPR
jgi:hypothetical protein